MVIDIFSRKVVGWAMSGRLYAELVVDALDMAIKNRRPAEGLIHHSDHGSQYTSLALGKRLEQKGILSSMGAVGNALDNAVAESFFSTLQAELLDKQPWAKRAELRLAIFEYLEVFYNRQRLHSTSVISTHPSSKPTGKAASPAQEVISFKLSTKSQ